MTGDVPAGVAVDDRGRFLALLAEDHERVAAVVGAYQLAGVEIVPGRDCVLNAFAAAFSADEVGLTSVTR